MTYNDPFIRSAYFFLLANLSTLGTASTGALLKEKNVEMDFSHIDEKIYNIQKAEQVSMEHENICTLINCNTFNIDILSHSDGSAIDQTKLNGPEMIEKYKSSYEPWIIGFYSDPRIQKYKDKLNLCQVSLKGNIPIIIENHRKLKLFYGDLNIFIILF